jgi:hypothetical protein
MPDRLALNTAVLEYISTCRKDGKPVDLHFALELLGQHPESGLTIREVRNRLEEAAILKQVPLRT